MSVTGRTIRTKIENLIKKANSTSGQNAKDLTSSVNALIAGYGEGAKDFYDGYIEIDGAPAKDTIDYVREAKAEGLAEGRKTALTEFWGEIQEYGARTAYNSSPFKGYTDNMFNPQFDFIVSDARTMFCDSKITNLEQKLAENNVILDISNARGPLNSTGSEISGILNWLLRSTITHLPSLKVGDYVARFGLTFNGASELKSIRSIEAKATPFTFGYHRTGGDGGGWVDNKTFIYTAFDGCGNLEEIHSIFTNEFVETTIENTEESDGEWTHLKCDFGYMGDCIDVSMCPKLSRETLLRISDGLGDKRKVLDNFSAAGIPDFYLDWFEFQCIFGAENLAKLTEEEITAITDKGWSVS